MRVQVGLAPCDTCGRELMTDERLGAWYFGASCDYIHGDGCPGHADGDKATTDEIDVY